MNSYPEKIRNAGHNKIFVYLTCLYILTWYLQFNYRIQFLGTIRFEFLLGSLLTIGALFALASSRTGTPPLTTPVLLFLAILFFYTIFSYDVEYSWTIFFDRGVKYAMLALFFTAFIRTPWALKMVVGAFLLAMLKLGQEGFVGWYTGSQMWQNQGVMRLHGSVSMYGHPNSFSGMAVGCLPFVYYLFPAVSRFYKCLLLLLFVFCIVIIVFTGSRTGYVATFGLVVVFLLKSHRKEIYRYILLATILAASAIYFAPPDYIERFHSIFTMEEKQGASSNKRLEIMKDAVDIYCAYPFGVGVGAFPLVRKNMFGRWQDTHNLYLELLTNLGPLGLVAFLNLIYHILRTCSEFQRQVENVYFDDKLFVLAVSRAIVAFIYARLFLGLFGMDTYEIYWWFAAGIVNSLWSIMHINELSRHRQALL